MIILLFNNVPTYEITNLTEYMDIVKTQQLNTCISRGESCLHANLTAAAFRRNSSLDIKSMVEEFRSYVGNSLTEMQNKHFLAFSQHYGLPTNLLDFTYSPLISLYFACSDAADSDGYIYFLSKSRLIDITSHLPLVSSAFLPKFLIAAEELEDLFRGIASLFAAHAEYVPELLAHIDRGIGGHPSMQAIHNEIQRLLSEADIYDIERLDRLITLMDKRAKALRGLSTDIPLHNLGSYCHILVRFLTLLIFIVRQDGGFDLPFYFTYEPANITNRISNQSSIFIYQLYGINDLRQTIAPDCVVKVGNKAEILADLDCMGINEKFIFNDYDHIASYIKQKHLRCSDARDVLFSDLKKYSQSLADCE